MIEYGDRMRCGVKKRGLNFVKSFFVISLASLTIPDSVTTIGKESFLGCSALQSIVIGNSVASIGEQTFADCSSLSSLTIPDSVTIIKECAFIRCSSLQSIVIGNSVTSIGKQAFCTFAGCSSLSSLKIPNSVTQIERAAFLNCSALSDIVIPDGATLGINVFQGCTGLETISSASFHMSVAGYFRESHHLRIKLRVTVLNCLKLINKERMRLAEEPTKRRKLNSDGRSSSESGFTGWFTNRVTTKTTREEFDGVRAESKITAFELWMEILEFV